MMAKPMKTLELRYPMIQFLMIGNNRILHKTQWTNDPVSRDRR